MDVSSTQSEKIIPFVPAGKEEYSITGILIKIRAQYGDEAVLNKNRCVGLFTDFAPKQTKDRNLLQIFLKCGGAALGTIQDAAQRKDEAMRIVGRMAADYPTTKTAARAICREYASVFGFTISGFRAPAGKKAVSPKTNRTSSEKKPSVQQSVEVLRLPTADYTAMARLILEGIGGTENLISIDHSFIRLKLEVKDLYVIDEKKIKSSGAAGVICPGKYSVQVVFGPKAPFVYEEFKKLADK